MNIRSARLALAPIILFFSCTDPQGVATSFRGVSVSVGAGCSLEQAVQATNNPGTAVGSCAIASSSMPNVIEIPTGTYDRPTRLDVNRAVTIQGDCSSDALGCVFDPDPFASCSSFPVLEMAMRDRAFLINVPGVSLRCMQIRNVCPNGGTCSSNVNGSVPTGGGWYALKANGFSAYAMLVDGGTARDACGYGICDPTQTTPSLVERFAVRNCVALAQGGGGASTHVDMTERDSFYFGNRTRNGQGDGGNRKIYGGHVVLERVHLLDGVSENGQGGNLSVAAPISQFATETDPIVVDVFDSVLRAGVANGNGGDVAISAGTLQEVTVNFTNTLFDGGTTDSPTSYPPGNGGLIAAVDYMGRLATANLLGTTQLVGGNDLSVPISSQTFGRVNDLRSLPPVCGNGVLEAGEECDDGNANPSDPCSATCTNQVETCTWGAP